MTPIRLYGQSAIDTGRCNPNAHLQAVALPGFGARGQETKVK